MRKLFATFLLLVAGACSSEQPQAAENSGNAVEASGYRVDASGKVAVPLDQLPPGVLQAVKERAPDLKLAQVETETRNAVRYYDVAGTAPNGSEMELDIMQDGGSWRVVETQRDVAFPTLPPAVQAAARERDAALSPSRVIESRQEDGVVIYEVYEAKGNDPEGQKMEVRWNGTQAEVLTAEWVH